MWLPRRLKLGSCASLQQAACYVDFPRLHCGTVLCQMTLCGASYPRGTENSSQRIFTSLPVVFFLCPVPTKMKKNEISEAAFYIHEIKKPSKRVFIHAFRFTVLQTCGNLLRSFALLSSSLWIQPEVSRGLADEMLNGSESKQNRSSPSIPRTAPLAFNDIRKTQKPQLC